MARDLATCQALAASEIGTISSHRSSIDIDGASNETRIVKTALSIVLVWVRFLVLFNRIET